MRDKKLFTELLYRSGSEIKLKIDNEYIYHKNNHIYFINIDFNYFNFQDNKAQVLVNNKNYTIKVSNKVYDNNIDIFFGAVQISFYCCSFMKEIPSFSTKINVIYRCNIQDDLNYMDNILFKNCYFTNLVNKLPNIQGGKIENLSLTNYTCEDKFYINKQYGKNSRKTTINNLIIKDTTFKENFKLHNCEINNMDIEDTDFEKHQIFSKQFFIMVKQTMNLYILKLLILKD
jgi:hypothetical protein